ncbi:unnamed protein product, partial [Mesorhabditis belari]|uniref:Uncharacterized protein n=1 Tax=Mesorhabditis belari TaxID=2138241 RepID=A0AAF3F1A4_9BILA
MVRCVQFDGIRVVSGALDGTVKAGIRRTLAIILLTYLMSNFLSVLITVWEMFDPASLWKPGWVCTKKIFLKATMK